MIDFGLAIWPLLLLCAIAAGLTWITYRRSTPRLRGFYAWLLPTLRFVALLLLLGLLFEPILRRVVRNTTEPVLGVLIDESQSMSLHPPVNELPTIDGELQFFGFGNSVRPLESLDAARDTAPRTDIGQALRALRASQSDKPVTSALLVTDGRFNTGSNPLFVAEDFGIPVHTVAIGDTAEQVDVRIVQILTNDIAYVGQDVPVEVIIFSEGLGATAATAELYGRDRLITSVPVNLRPGETRIRLNHSPQAEGLQPYTVQVSVQENEASVINNQSSFTTRVLRRTQQILLVAAAPHPDVASISSILKRGDGRNVRTFVQRSPGSFYEGPLTVVADSCDLIVLVGYPGDNADSEDLAIFRRLAQEGMPLLFILSNQTSLEILRRSLADVLPAMPQQTRMPFDEASFTPTLNGLKHPILNFEQSGWAALPPLIFGTGRWGLGADAEVLGLASVRGVELDEPLLVVRNQDGHRSAMLLGSGTWRWLNLSEDPQTNARIWPQLLENMVQWLTAPENDQRVRVTPTASTFDGSESVMITGQVYDESLRPVSDAELTLDLVADDLREYPYTLQNEGGGRYSLTLESLPEGVYEYRAQAMRLGESLGSDQGSFSVATLGLEYRQMNTDAALLRQIALRSGGRYFTPATLADLPDMLASDSVFAPMITSDTTERELWRWPAMAMLILVLLSAEWILRKRNGLV